MVDDDAPIYFLIEKDGERQCVESLDGYDDWAVLQFGDDAKPIDDAEFDGERWAVPLALLKQRKWTEIKEAREAARYGGCTTAKGVIDSDPESQRKVGGAVSMAMMLGEQFTMEWTMADNTGVVFNAADMQAAGVALGMFEGQCHAIGRTLRAQIDAATTVEELDAIVWPSNQGEI